MNQKAKPKKLVPGHARIGIQIYNAGPRSYSHAPGFSRSRIHVRTQRELNRLWKEVEDVIDRGAWRDLNVEPAPPVPPAAEQIPA